MPKIPFHRNSWTLRHSAITSLACMSIFVPALRANLEVVDIQKVDPSIVIDLRYATPHNVTGRALYPPNARALILPSVAQQLAGAQKYLKQYKYGLKIWDAYRPKEAQVLLWKLAGKGDFVANPESGVGSLHSWGVSVDATLVDDWGGAVSMPTGFDEFTPAAMLHYQGSDPVVKAHLTLLQLAMAHNNFYGLRVEWWHFTTADWQKYVPYQEGEENAPKKKPDDKKLKSAAQKDQGSKT
jgi:D-alanyl-D-alanine dipeptidase